MTAPTSRAGDCLHAWEGMPWVLQGSASQEQQRWLRGHLEQCSSCQAEFVHQRAIRRAMQLPVDVDIDPERGLRRLLARIDGPAAAMPLAQPAQRPWLKWGLAAAVVAQTIGIGAMGVRLWHIDVSPSYRTLSDPVSAAPVTGALHVVPEKTMTLAEWDALLLSLQLQVIDGPNRVGAYTVHTTASGASAGDVLDRLRAAKGIRFAEPVAPAP
jgi:hypothetical protein